MLKVIAFTDGSATYLKDKKGGFGVYFPDYQGQEVFLSKGYYNTTVNRMEMMAVLFTIQRIPETIKCHLHIYSDSKLVVNSFTEEWLKNWQISNFKRCKNGDLWRLMVKCLEEKKWLKFTISHIDGHLKDLNDPIVYGNHMADALASYKTHENYKKDIRN